MPVFSKIIFNVNEIADICPRFINYQQNISISIQPIDDVLYGKVKNK